MLFSRKTFLAFLVTFRQWRHGNTEASVFLVDLSTQTINEIGIAPDLRARQTKPPDTSAKEKLDYLLSSLNHIQSPPWQ